MKKYSAIIVDDERLARKALQNHLSPFESIEVVGEANSIQKAVELVNRTSPDIIFLDVQMPGESGFDLFEAADIKSHVVFVTAHDQYALRAFDVNALDYLLKPISPERLKQTIEKIIGNHGNREIKQQRYDYDDRILLSSGSKMKLAKISTIVSISSKGDYSVVNFDNDSKLTVLRSMKLWGSILPGKEFVRIHRSTIININFVDKIEKRISGVAKVHLKNSNTSFTLSKRYFIKLKESL
ncbi:MAG: response regulator [Bacteroidota bacterium]